MSRKKQQQQSSEEESEDEKIGSNKIDWSKVGKEKRARYSVEKLEEEKEKNKLRMRMYREKKVDKVIFVNHCVLAILNVL